MFVRCASRSLVAVVCFSLATWHGAFAQQRSAEKQAASARFGWIRLFDGKSFHGWYTKIPNQKTGEDPEKYFQVDDGVIHVYKNQADGTEVPNGYLATDAEYAYYHL